MPRRFKQGAGVVLSAAVASQAGHLLAYGLRYGAAAGAVQSQGAHAYFPVAAQLAGGLAGLAALVCLLVLGAARRLGAGGPLERRPLMDYLPVFFALQLGFFFGQETVESLVAGAPAPDAVALLLWGAVGQLPAALVAALAFSWFAARVAPALRALRRRRRLPRLRGPLALRPPAEDAFGPRLTVARSAPAVLVKRGPPHLAPV